MHLSIDSLLAFALLGVGLLSLVAVFFFDVFVVRLLDIGVVVFGVLLGVVVLLDVGILFGVVVFLDVAEVLIGVDIVLEDDRAAIHTDKVITTIRGKALNTASMAIFSTAVKSVLSMLIVDLWCRGPFEGVQNFPSSLIGYIVYS